MDDVFKILEGLGISQNLRAEPFAVDNSVDHRSGKPLFDQRGGYSAIKRMHCRIGIIDRHMMFVEHCTGCRFAHPDRACQAKHKGHRAINPFCCNRTSKGSIGIPMIVLRDPSIRPNNRAPSASIW